MSGEIKFLTTVEDAMELKRWLGERRPVLALDTETGGLSPYNCALRLVQFGDATGGWAVPAEDWRGLLKDLLGAYDRDLVLHNARFDAHFISHHLGVELDWTRVHDTMLQSHVLDPPGRHGLKYLADRLIHPGASGGEQALKAAMHKGKWGWDTVPIDLPEYWSYGVMDTMLTAMLHERFTRELEERHLTKVYELERAVTPTIYKMERRGCLIDRNYCDQKRIELQTYCDTVREWAKNEYGIDNVTSNRQVTAALIDDGVTFTVRTPGGDWSLTEPVLAGINHPLAQALVDIRKATKIASTYFVNFLRYANEDNEIHPQIHQVAARTGRMAIKEPALQTLPKGPIVRDAFIARPGYRLISADYDQVELRIFASFAQETDLIEAIRKADAGEGPDLHTYAAQVAYGDTTITKSDPRRNLAKNTAFCCVPETTQALTQRGWLKHDEITLTDRVLGHSGDTLVWQPVTGVVHYDNAPLVAMSNAQWSTETTPNHRWLAEKRTDHGKAGRTWDRQYVTTEGITNEHRLILSMPLAATDQSGITPDECALIGWIITDGTVRWSSCDSGLTSQMGGEKRGVQTAIFQSKAVGVSALRDLFGRMGFTSHEYPHSGGFAFNIPPHVIRPLWLRAGLTGRHTGVEGLVRKMGPEQLHSFVEAICLAEGHLKKDGKWVLSQNTGEVLEAMRLAVFLTGQVPSRGYTATAYTGKDHTRFSFARTRLTGQRLLRTDAGSGPVWCLNTPSSTWVARDLDGNIFLTGNTIYGGGAAKIAETAGVTEDEARSFLDTYMEAFPGIRRFQKQVEQVVKARIRDDGVGYVNDPFGRYHPLLEDEGAYKCANYLIQGSAASVLKERMISVANAGFGDALLLPVHDELIFELPEDETAAAIPEIVEAMEDLHSFAVPLRVSVSKPEMRWGSCK